MNIILWIVFGAIVGWLASVIMRTNGQQNLLLDIVVGIVGAVLGGWIMTTLGAASASGFTFYSFVVALIGAVVLLAIVKAIRRA